VSTSDEISNVCICKDKHSSIITDPECGEDVCANCGTVLSDKIIRTSPEWRVIGQYDRRIIGERGGVSLSLAIHDTGLSTVIGKENRDASGKHLDPTLRSRFWNLRMWDHLLQYDSGSRNLTHAFVQLRTCKEKMGLPYSVVERTAYIYRRVQKKRMIMGRTMGGVLAACVYIACRQAGIPRTLNDVAKASNITYKEISSAYRLIVFGFDLRMPSIDQIYCLVRLANATEVSERVKRQSINFMKEIIEKELSAGKDPMGLAAAVLYLACQHHGDTTKTQRYFADAAGVTDVTIRNRCNELRNKMPGMMKT
jgi:transcription initiation factor TFIIB